MFNMFNRNFSLLLLSGIILGAPLPMLILLGGLAGIKLAPDSSLATLAPSIQIFAGVVIAAPISIFMGKYGRRTGFLLGGGMIIIGGVLGSVALIVENFYILCIAHFSLGAGLICMGFMRFAAAEAVDDQYKPSAMSITLASGLIATFIAAEIFSFSKDMLSTAPLAGAYIAVALLGALGCIPVLALRLKPQTAETNSQNSAIETINIMSVLKRKSVALAVSAAAISAAVMTFMMIPTPLAMIGNGFSEDQAGDVIRWHFIAMFAPGFFTGWLIQKFGSRQIISVGMLIIAVGAICAILDVKIFNFYIALFLLGLGWNFGFIGASSLLQSSLSIAERGKLQGVNDTIIALCSTFASLLAGVIIAQLGWLAIAMSVLPLVVLAFAMTVYLMIKNNQLSVKN